MDGKDIVFDGYNDFVTDQEYLVIKQLNQVKSEAINEVKKEFNAGISDVGSKVEDLGKKVEQMLDKIFESL